MFYVAAFSVLLGNRSVAGDFHRPYETQDVLRFSVQRAARKAQHCGRFSSPLRNSECFTFQRSACYSEDAALRAIFIARNSGCFTLQRSTCRSESAAWRAIFIARNSGCFTLQRSTCRSETAALRAIFIAPTKSRSQRGSGKRKYWYTPRATTTVDIDTRGKAG